MSKILKRTGTDFFISDTGETVPGDGQLIIDPQKYQLYSRSDATITAIASGDLVYNDGSSDLGLSDAIDHLKGYQFKPALDAVGNQITAVKKIVGKDFSAQVSHDFTKKCSWYQDSVRVTGETLSGSGVGPYQAVNTQWINLTQGLNPREDIFNEPYLWKIYDNGVEKTSGFTVDCLNGTVTFDNTPIGPITADYSYPNGSTWYLIPESGKVINVEHAELDFTTDINFEQVHFEIWAYNPYDLPNKLLVERVTYKGMKDVLKIANEVQVVPPIANITNSVMRAVFDYGSMISLKSSQGAELRIRTEGDVQMTGEFGSITLYTLIEDE